MILAERHYVKFGLWYRISVCLSLCRLCTLTLIWELNFSAIFFTVLYWLSDNFHAENHGHRPTGSPPSRARPRGSQGRIWTYRKRCYL